MLITNSTELNKFLALPANALAKLTSLEISDTMAPRPGHWFRHLDDTQAEKLLTAIRKCSKLQTVKLDGHLYLINTNRFIALGNTFSELKGIQINLTFEGVVILMLQNLQGHAPNVNFHILGTVLSYWPIKTLDLSGYLGVLDPVFWDALAHCPIQVINLSGRKLNADGYFALGNFLERTETVRSINFSQHSPIFTIDNFDTTLLAFCSVLAKGEQLEILNLSMNELSTIDEKSFNRLCLAIAQLKSLRSIHLGGNGFDTSDSNRFERLCRDALAQCPDLQAMELRDALNNKPLPCTASFCQNIINGLKYLSVLSHVKINDLWEQNPRDPSVMFFKHRELVLQASGLLGDGRKEAPLFRIRNQILFETYKNRYAKYYLEGYLSYIREQNRSRYLEPFVTASLALRHLGFDKESRLESLKYLFPHRHAKCAESVDNSIDKVLNERIRMSLDSRGIEKFWSLSAAQCATLMEIQLPRFLNLDRILQLRDNLLQCRALKTITLFDYINELKIDDLMELVKIYTQLGALKTFEAGYDIRSYISYVDPKINDEHAERMNSTLERLQSEFNTNGFKTKRIILEQNKRGINITPQEVKGVLKSYDHSYKSLTFTFVRKTIKPAVFEETTGNTLRIANG